MATPGYVTTTTTTTTTNTVLLTMSERLCLFRLQQLTYVCRRRCRDVRSCWFRSPATNRSLASTRYRRPRKLPRSDTANL